MADPKGFLKHARDVELDRPPHERVHDLADIHRLLPVHEVQRQASRCMDCGIPFCHQGCPVGHRIPTWNDLVMRDRWEEALQQEHAANDFPEFTGYTCPAPCESACTLEVNDDPVTIKQIEVSIIEHGFESGLVQPRPPESRTGRSVGVIGSGPAGLAAANQLNQAGHHVVVYERDELPGGLLRFGIPDFKMEKHVIDRRLDVLSAEGIEFVCDVEVGDDLCVEELRDRHDALVVAAGAQVPRPLEVPGVELEGVVPAMEYLVRRNRLIAASQQRYARRVDDPQRLSARDRHVLVIGGGDTGADCVANAHREPAASVTQLDRYPEPEGDRSRELTRWPRMPRRFRTDYAGEEGGQRDWGSTVLELHGRAGRVTSATVAELGGPPDFSARPGTERAIPADLVLGAIGFLHPPQPLLRHLGVAVDERGLSATDGSFATSAEGIFAAGDARRGATLVVWAIDEGRRCAAAVDAWLAEREGTAPRVHRPEAGRGPVPVEQGASFPPA